MGGAGCGGRGGSLRELYSGEVVPEFLEIRGLRMSHRSDNFAAPSTDGAEVDAPEASLVVQCKICSLRSSKNLEKTLWMPLTGKCTKVTYRDCRRNGG